MDTVLFSFEQLQIGSMKYFLEQARENKKDVLKYWAFCANGILNAAILLEIYVTWFVKRRVETLDEEEFFNSKPGFAKKWKYSYKNFREDYTPNEVPLLPEYNSKKLDNIRKTVETRNTIVHYTTESIANLLSEEQL